MYSNHKKRKFYEFFRKIIRSFPLLEKLLQKILITIRVRKAKNILDYLYLYPEKKLSILEDYKFSILKNHRSPLQILNIEMCMEYLESKKIVGSLVETGVYKGGCSSYILKSAKRNLKKNLKNYNFWGFDSFEGMPAPTKKDGTHGIEWIYGKDSEFSKIEQGALVGHDTNFANYSECKSYLEDTSYPKEQINLIKGWFQNTLPGYKNEIGNIALLRLDGDFYESTKVVFETLYEQVLPGGVIILDDYGAFEGCRLATDEFLAKQKKTFDLFYVDHSIRYFFKH